MNKKIPLLRTFCLLAVSLCLFTAGVLAQSQATTGNIEGRVVDQNGAVVPNASVTAKNQDTGFEKSVNADAEGNYRIILLPPGKYTITVKGAQGFADAKYANVVVTVGGQTPLEVQLGVAGASVDVDIATEGQIVETGRTSVSSTVNERAIENLPVNGRNYLDFATLTPGVVREPTRTGDLSVGGQKGTLNSLQVDGTDNNNTFFGQAFGRTGVRPPYQFSEESVQEFQVNQNGFSAEFGRAGGAVINVVTKSGTNDWHGSLFLYFRDEALNANSPSVKIALTPQGQPRPNVRPPLQIKQFGGTLGGPIKRDRAFFFFTYDGQRSNIPNVVELPNFGAQPPAIQAGLIARLGSKLNPYQIGRDQDVFMFKTDIKLNGANQLSVRFNQQNFTGNNNENSGVGSAQEHSGNSIAKTTTFSGNLASTLTNNLVNEFRFQFARDREPGEANSSEPEAQIRTGGTPSAFFIGRNNFSPRETTIKRAQFVDNLTYIKGAHNFKFGLDFNFDRIFNFFPGVFSGTYLFPSYTAFVNNTPSNYQQNFAGAGTSGPVTKPNFNEYGFFAQDDWRVTRKLTLNLGVRYDYQDLADPTVKNTSAVLASNILGITIDTTTPVRDGNNIAPRLGFSYAFDEKTVLRGGYGIFYGRTPAIMLATAHSNNGVQVTGVNLTCTTTPSNPCPIYPNVFSAPPTLQPANPNIYLFAKDYAQPYVQQGRLGIEREIIPNLSLSATYLFFRGVHLSRTRDINLFPPVATNVTDSNGQVFVVQRFPGQPPPNQNIPARPIPGFNRISLFESTANSVYNALAVEAKKRFTRGIQFIAAYTFSRARDNKPEQTAVVVPTDDFKLVQNNFNLRDEWARSDLDIPHRFVFSPVYEIGKYTRSDNAFVQQLLGNRTFSGIVTLQSGFTHSATIAGDANRDGNSSTDRVPGLERNAFRTPSIYIVDARATKSFTFGERYKLSFVAEAFNLFNRSNIATVNTARYTISSSSATTFGNPAASSPFGGPRTFIGERQIQLAVRFKF